MSQSSSLFIHSLLLGPWKNRVYLVGDRDTGSCAVVDPAWHVESILELARNQDVQIDTIICTHSHQDHTDGVDALQMKTGATVHMLQSEIAFAKFQSRRLIAHQDGDVLNISGHAIKWLHTPGHSPGSACLYIEKLGALLTGDTLFVGGCGRCDLAGGDAKAMHQSLHRLLKELPPHTEIYPGHDYGKTSRSSLQAEALQNRFLLAPNLQAFVAMRMVGTNPPVPLSTRLPAWTPAR